MPLDNFTNIKQAILSWSTRDELTAEVTDFIRLSEARMEYGTEDGAFPTKPLRVRQMQQRSTAALPAQAEYLTIPPDFVEGQNVQLNLPRKRDLRYVTPQQLDITFDTSLRGQPTYYTLIGDEFRFHPIPEKEYEIETMYYRTIPKLSDAQPTNWLLSDYPNVYLYGGLLELSVFIQEDVDIQKNGRLFSGAMVALQRSGRDSQFIGPLRARTDVNPGSHRLVRV